MEGHCSTGQSPQWAVVPMEEEEVEEEEVTDGFHGIDFHETYATGHWHRRYGQNVIHSPQ